MGKNKKGSITVEASIVIPLILIVIFTIFNLSMQHYQNIVTRTELMSLASRIAAHWDSLNTTPEIISTDTNMGKNLLNNQSFVEHDPYRYFFDSKSEAKLSQAILYANKKMQGILNIKDGKSVAFNGVIVKKEGNIFQKYVTVTIPSKDEVTAKATMVNPSEFVRNVSFIYDIVKGTE